jgi:hypothetical protein
MLVYIFSMQFFLHLIIFIEKPARPLICGRSEYGLLLPCFKQKIPLEIGLVVALYFEKIKNFTFKFKSPKKS